MLLGDRPLALWSIFDLLPVLAGECAQVHRVEKSKFGCGPFRENHQHSGAANGETVQLFLEIQGV